MEPLGDGAGSGVLKGYRSSSGLEVSELQGSPSNSWTLSEEKNWMGPWSFEAPFQRCGGNISWLTRHSLFWSPCTVVATRGLVLLGFAGVTHMGTRLVSERVILTFFTLSLGGRTESRRKNTIMALYTVSSLEHGVALQSTKHRLDWPCMRVRSICIFIIILFIFLMGWYWVHLVLRPLFGLLYQPQMIDDACGAIDGMRIGRGTEVLGETYPSASLPTTNPTWP
jgi:hypothetical protein